MVPTEMEPADRMELRDTLPDNRQARTMPGRPPCPKCDARLLLVQVRSINNDVGIHRYECMNCDFIRENPLGKGEAHPWMGHRAPPVMITVAECRATAAHRLRLAVATPHRRAVLMASADRWVSLADRIHGVSAGNIMLRNAVLDETYWPTSS